MTIDTSANLPDPRRNAYRPDLAASHLRGVVDAERYTDGTAGRIVHPSVPLRKRSDVSLGFETEVLFGESVTVFDEAEGWAWIQIGRDGYVGYVPVSAVRPNDGVAANNRVTALGTFIYSRDDIKSPPIMPLPMNALIRSVGMHDRFLELQHGGFVIARHCAPIEKAARDYVDIAERLIGTPYLWGGNTRLGIDCSGLVQMSMLAAKLIAPRDSDMQRNEIGTPVEIVPEYDGLQRGDLVFWKGHVAIMLDSIMLVHANAHHMAVATEPLPEAATRIARADGGQVIAIKRPAALTA